MIENDKLRGIVYGKFKNEQGFANALGWSKQRLNATLKDLGSIKISTAQHMTAVLGLELDTEAWSLFLPNE